jgi:hypothetical protein
VRTKKIAVILFLTAAGAVCVPKAKAENLVRISPLPQFISDTYQEKDILISFSRAYSRTDNYASQFCVELNIRVLSENKILKPNKYAYGIYIRDNFGNDLNVVNIAPRYFENLRPGERRLFIITADIMPLDNTKYLLLQIPRGIFGNVNPFELKIFNTGFKDTTTQERAMLESGVGLGGWDKEDSNGKFLPDDIIQKNRGIILYTAVFIEICALCALAAIVFVCLKKAKKTVLNDESLLGFCFHRLAKTNPPISLLYIFSLLIYVVWLMFGLIIVVAGGIGNLEDMFGILFFLAVWGLLALVVLWVIYEALNKWRVINHN